MDIRHSIMKFVDDLERDKLISDDLSTRMSIETHVSSLVAYLTRGIESEIDARVQDEVDEEDSERLERLRDELENIIEDPSKNSNLTTLLKHLTDLVDEASAIF